MVLGENEGVLFGCSPRTEVLQQNCARKTLVVQKRTLASRRTMSQVWTSGRRFS